MLVHAYKLKHSRSYTHSRIVMVVYFVLFRDSQSSQTSDDNDDLNRLSYPKNSKSKSAENILDTCHFHGTSADDPDDSFASNTPTSDVPPPKPPMPQRFWDLGNIGKFNRLLLRTCPIVD